MDRELYKKLLDKYIHTGEFICIDSCQKGYIYAGIGRNFNIALYFNEKFYGIRYKFGETFIDSEIHWSEGNPYGTFIPVMKCMEYKRSFDYKNIYDDDLEDVLDKLSEELESVEGTSK